MLNSIDLIKTIICEKDNNINFHSERVSQICKKIGESMNFSNGMNSDLVALALLHDLGKITISNDILMKKGELTKEEWNKIKRHPETGYNIISSIPKLEKIAPYVLYHHERWDGKGYPYGIIGNNIPLLSRIIAVVDAYDAMISDRPYRKAQSIEIARKELIKNAGTQFDPNVVKIFLNTIF